MKMAEEAAAADAETVATYVVRPGFTHSYVLEGSRTTAVVGDKVQLTANQYEAFRDKFYTEIEAEAYAEAIEAAVAALQSAAEVPEGVNAEDLSAQGSSGSAVPGVVASSEEAADGANEEEPAKAEKKKK